MRPSEREERREGGNGELDVFLLCGGPNAVWEVNSSPSDNSVPPGERSTSSQLMYSARGHESRLTHAKLKRRTRERRRRSARQLSAYFRFPLPALELTFPRRRSRSWERDRCSDAWLQRLKVLEGVVVTGKPESVREPAGRGSLLTSSCSSFSRCVQR